MNMLRLLLSALLVLGALRLTGVRGAHADVKFDLVANGSMGLPGRWSSALSKNCLDGRFGRELSSLVAVRANCSCSCTTSAALVAACGLTVRAWSFLGTFRK